MKLYLDTSVVLKLYKAETDTSAVEKIIKDMAAGRIWVCTSQLTINELLRGLSKQGLSLGELDEIEKDLRSYEKKGLHFIPVTEEILKESLIYIKKNKLHVIDAIHLATAIKNSDILVTEDEDFLKQSLKKTLKIKTTSLKEYRH